LVGCGEQQSKESAYLRWVGDIEQNPELDDPDFTLCNGDENVIQYFNLSTGFQYEGEKQAVIEHFSAAYKPVVDESQSGWIRIRFIVNCEGRAGRFRLTAADYNYNEKVFSTVITDQLLTIIQSMDGWQVLRRKSGNPVDYYLYLTFKLKAGVIVEILP
jgi:hypothetical protein